MRHMRLKVISGYYRTLKWSFSRLIVSPCYNAANLLESCRLSSRAVIRVRNAHLKHLISFRLDRFNLACPCEMTSGKRTKFKTFHDFSRILRIFEYSHGFSKIPENSRIYFLQISYIWSVSLEYFRHIKLFPGLSVTPSHKSLSGFSLTRINN